MPGLSVFLHGEKLKIGAIFLVQLDDTILVQYIDGDVQM